MSRLRTKGWKFFVWGCTRLIPETRPSGSLLRKLCKHVPDAFVEPVRVLKVSIATRTKKPA